VNDLALLGWGPEGNQEFFTLAELIQKFTLKRLTRSGARFDKEKLRWINAQHLRKLSETEYLEKIRNHFNVGAGLPPPQGAETAPLPTDFSSEKLARIALLFASRIQTLQDLALEASYCFNEVEVYDLDAMNRSLRASGLREKLMGLREAFESLPDFEDSVELEKLLRQTARNQGVEAKVLIHPLRLALTGKDVSPGIFELARVLGKEICLKRLDRLIEKL
jgi:glutamyl/glutaminyl-tRNA synthetase